MLTIILTKGLPASGKTTWAENFVQGNPEYRNLNRDDLRYMLFGKDYKFSKARETQISDAQENLARMFIKDGLSLVISDTNLNPKVEQRWKVFAEYWKASFVIQDFTDVPLHTCIERDLLRGEKVGKKVINGMYTRYLEPKPYEGNTKNPNAVVFDIDGTLAKMTTRGPFDWDRVGEDELIQQTLEALEGFGDQGYHIILLSGRDGICEPQTKQWLEDHGVLYDRLFMRAEGDNRPDYIVKDELFTNHVEPDYNVFAVVDDRPQVCRMWRQKGLFVFNVGNPDLDF